MAEMQSAFTRFEDLSQESSLISELIRTTVKSFRHYDHSQTEAHPVMLEPVQEPQTQSEHFETNPTVQDQIDEFHF